MKCGKCGSEWTAGPSVNVNIKCPFCGADIIVSTAEDAVSISAVMRSVVKNYGTDILWEGKKLTSLLTDLAPEQINEIKVLGSVYGTNITDTLKNALDGDDDAQGRASQVFRKRLVDEAWLAEEAAGRITSWFTFALGWADAATADTTTGTGITKQYDNGTYVGDFLNDKHHGKGKFTWNSGSVYEGEWQNGKCHGKGKLTMPDGLAVEGTWENGILVTSSSQSPLSSMTAKGVIIINMNNKKNSGMYNGDMKDGHRDGHGVFRWLNGDIYDGEWKKDHKHGQGKMTYSDGRVESGFWNNGTFIGKNITIKIKGGVYTGETKNGKRHGKGKFTAKNGDIYEGEWRDNQFTGKGTVTYTSGGKVSGVFNNGQLVQKAQTQKQASKKTAKTTIKYNNGTYTGETLNGKPHGKGKFTWANGDVYEGDWKDDKRTGKGKYTWPNGDVYEGGFVESYLQGFGVYRYSNGDVYEGEWFHGNRNGKGRMTRKNGTIEEGIWKDNTLTQPQQQQKKQQPKPQKQTNVTKKYPDGTYTGDTLNGHRHGKGKFVFNNGSVYEGSWHLGDMRRGKMTYPDGCVYDGNWLNGKESGRGTMTYPDGSIYTGRFANGLKDGKGVLKRKNGKEYDEEWKNGRQINKPGGFIDNILGSLFDI